MRYVKCDTCQKEHKINSYSFPNEWTSIVLDGIEFDFCENHQELTQALGAGWA